MTAVPALTVLGVSTPYPRPDAPCSGYVVRAGARSLWVDAGSGTLGNLLRHVRLEDLSGIWLSHLHADHSADLLTAYYALRFSELAPQRPIPVFGPRGWAERMEHFLASDAPNPMAAVFDVHELDGAMTTTLDDTFALAAVPVAHNVPAFGLRVTFGDGTVFAYSGDTAPCPALAALAASADLLLCEAGAPDRTREAAQGHSSPEGAAELAREARVRRLLLTHLAPGSEAADVARRAAAVFGAPVEVARTGQTFPIA